MITRSQYSLPEPDWISSPTSFSMTIDMPLCMAEPKTSKIMGSFSHERSPLLSGDTLISLSSFRELSDTMRM